MIHIEQLSKRFAAQGAGAARWRWPRAPKMWVQAVQDISLRAENGSITGLLGANGAGKTTTLRMLAGLMQPDSGRLLIDGRDVRLQRTAALAQLGMLSDARGLYPRLTARENIVYFARLHGLSDAQAQARADLLADLLDLRPLLGRATEGFSQGERVKTALARALVHDPANIVLDEPTNGLDVQATRALRETLRYLRSPAGGSKCIIFSSHIMQEVERLCDQVLVIAQGRIVASGSVPELLQSTGQPDFEDAFVQLAFASAAPPATDSGRTQPAANQPSALRPYPDIASAGASLPEPAVSRSGEAPCA